MKFELNENQQAKANVFKSMCNMVTSYAATSAEDMKVLTFHYIFSNSSGIGESCAIECSELGIGISLTDYESW